jgi:hypothetical protein
MSPPELPPELWSDIFGLLKRDVPPPWKQATWSDFHQDDLASVCLVSVVRMESKYVYLSVLWNLHVALYSLIFADLVKAVPRPSSAYTVSLDRSQRPSNLGEVYYAL